MEYPVPAYTSFTIPTGATTGARITFNENGNGEILVYNSGNQVVDSIGGSDGAIISGNTLELKQGNLFIGNAPTFTNAGSLGSFNAIFQGKIFLGSGTDGSAGSTQASLTAQFGTAGAVTGTANTPNFSFYSSNTGTTAVDVLVSGSVIQSDLTGVPVTWQTPSYNTGYSGGTSFATLTGQAMTYRLMPDDTLLIQGITNYGGGGSGSIMLFPAGYRPVVGHNPMGLVGLYRGGVVSQEGVVLDHTTGLFFMSGTPQAGDQYLFNLRLPLYHLS